MNLRMFSQSSLRRRFGLSAGLAALLMTVGMSTVINTSTVPAAQAACAALPTNNGNATFTVSVPTNGNYRFWAHLYSPSAGNNAVYLQVDDTLCTVTVGNNNGMAVGQFTWVDYQNGTTSNKINVNLTAGNHTVKMAGLDPGVGVDKVMFLADTNCVPTGDGNNCVATATTTPVAGGGTGGTPTPSPTTLVKPVPGAADPKNTANATPVAGTIVLPPPPKDQGITRTYRLNGSPIPSGDLDTTKMEDGEYTLEIIDMDASGNKTVKIQKLIVDNNRGIVGEVVGFLKKPLNIALIVLGLAALSGGVYAYWRFWVRPNGGNWAKLPGLGHSLAASAAPAAPGTKPMAPPPAPTGTIYPSKSEPKL